MKKLIRFIKAKPVVYNIGAPIATEDVNYSVPLLLNENIELLRERSDYLGLSLSYSTNNSLVINTNGNDGKLNYHIYNFKLGYFLLSKSIPALIDAIKFNEDKTRIIENYSIPISGWDYIDTYIEGYKEGQTYFNVNYEPIKKDKNLRTFLNIILEDLKTLFLKTPRGEFDNEWSFDLENIFPNRINHENIKKHGRYNGLLSKFVNVINTNPKTFAQFENKFSNITGFKKG